MKNQGVRDFAGHSPAFFDTPQAIAFTLTKSLPDRARITAKCQMQEPIVANGVLRPNEKVFGAMARANDKTTSTLAAEIRRQFGTETMTRFVRSLPAFKPDPEIPGNIRDLLGKLDGVEQSAADRHGQ